MRSAMVVVHSLAGALRVPRRNNGRACPSARRPEETDAAQAGPPPNLRPGYARLGTGMDKAGVGEHRRLLLAGLFGSVLEIGAGNGLNFGHYPRSVTRVVAVEPEPHLRALAEIAAARADVPITVTAGTAERIPATDGEYDAVVATLMLC